MKFHFSGICGAGMGNAAMMLAQAGHEVKGSDANPFPPMSDNLRGMGIPVFQGYSEENLSRLFLPEVQVIGNALSRDNAEAAAGEKAAWRKMSFPEVLSEFCLKGREVVVVAGTHGKTSTSAILSRILAKRGAGCFIGGIMKSGEPGCGLGDASGPFVIEGDEYGTSYFDHRSKFLHYRPTHLVLTHLELDHVDIFPDFDELYGRFLSLVDLVPEKGFVVHCGDVEKLRLLAGTIRGRSVSYGLGEDSDFRVLSRRREGDGTAAVIAEPDGAREEVLTPLIGDIYLLNLLGAWTMARCMGLSASEIRGRLAGFEGVKRRLEKLRGGPFILYNDFAHHPTAIEKTLRIVREEHPGAEIWALFDPRSASSRRNVFHGLFSRAFGAADRVILGPPHPDRKLDPGERLDVAGLARDIGKKAVGCSGEAELRSLFRRPVPDGTVVVIMSCGAFFNLPAELAKSADGSVAQPE